MTFADEIKTVITEDHTNTFSDDHFAEWFMDGTLTIEKMQTLTFNQIDIVAENIEQRWSEKDANRFMDWAVEHK